MTFNIINALKIPIPSMDCSQCVFIECSTANCPCVFPGTTELIYPRYTPVATTVAPEHCKYCPQPLCKCSFDVCTPEKIREWIG